MFVAEAMPIIESNESGRYAEASIEVPALLLLALKRPATQTIGGCIAALFEN
jgi:hypothetical protein